MIRVVAVDDHPMFRAGLIQAVSAEGDIVVIGEGDCAADSVRLAGQLRPDIMLLDAGMDTSGIERVAEIVQAVPQIRVIIVTASQDQNDVARAIDAGVSGYVLKGANGPDLRAIVRAVHAGETYMDRNVVGGLFSALKATTASPQQREREISFSVKETQALQALLLGLTNREIGAHLGIAERTVKFHLSSAFAKLQVRNRVEAGLAARRIWPELGG